jgi:hypothetical protein
MVTVLVLIASHLVAGGAGAYGWYRFGTRVKADANLIRDSAKKL